MNELILGHSDLKRSEYVENKLSELFRAPETDKKNNSHRSRTVHFRNGAPFS